MARWFALLEAEVAPREWAEAVAPLAALTGGSVDEWPHLTVGTGEGDATPAALEAVVSEVAAPDVAVRPRGPASFRAGAQLHFGWTFGVVVEKDAALREWHARVNAVLEGAGLLGPGGADPEGWRAHVTVIRGTAALPPPTPEVSDEVVRRLEECAPRLGFRATLLRVTRLEEGAFSTVALVRG